jgi:hypothetical protein
MDGGVIRRPRGSAAVRRERAWAGERSRIGPGAEHGLDGVPVEAAPGEVRRGPPVGGAVPRGGPPPCPLEGGAGARRLGLRVLREGRLAGLPAEAAGAQRLLDAAAAVEAPLGQRPRGVAGQRGVVEEAEAGRAVERRPGDLGGEPLAGELPRDLVARLPARGEGAAGRLEGRLDGAYLLKRSRVRSPSLLVAPFA